MPTDHPKPSEIGEGTNPPRVPPGEKELTPGERMRTAEHGPAETRLLGRPPGDTPRIADDGIAGEPTKIVYDLTELNHFADAEPPMGWRRWPTVQLTHGLMDGAAMRRDVLKDVHIAAGPYSNSRFATVLNSLIRRPGIESCVSLRSGATARVNVPLITVADNVATPQPTGFEYETPTGIVSAQGYGPVGPMAGMHYDGHAELTHTATWPTQLETVVSLVTSGGWNPAWLDAGAPASPHQQERPLSGRETYTTTNGVAQLRNWLAQADGNPAASDYYDLPGPLPVAEHLGSLTAAGHPVLLNAAHPDALTADDLTELPPGFEPGGTYEFSRFRDGIVTLKTEGVPRDIQMPPEVFHKYFGHPIGEDGQGVVQWATLGPSVSQEQRDAWTSVGTDPAS